MRERETATNTPIGVTTPSLDTVFDILADRRRRFVLYHLYDAVDGVSTVEELVDFVAVHEPDAGPSKDEIQVALYHIHLPKLEEAGVIEHDQRSETVRYWTHPSLEEWLEHASYKERES
ncbi:DUF7344 domain-containing protein [Natronosalvus amylolyticus]|uniref:DUF7344 domain-containing protein n=1 Tax=Natronosalvus amylolyticus TaxID=2961994 RepID=UPI0020C9A13A|nr:hypothetical protein [Natronosalvus amylolyticus]